MAYSFDTEIALDSLQKIKTMLELITERANVVKSPDDFLRSSGGMMRLERNARGTYWLHFAVRPEGNRRKIRLI